MLHMSPAQNTDDRPEAEAADRRILGRAARRALLVGLALALFPVFAADASATTFCVPGFHAACPAGGGNVSQPSLQTALNSNGDDGLPDRIVIAAGTRTQADTYGIPSGDNDDLEIAGVGPGASFITTSDTGSAFVMNLNGARDVTIRDLTLVVPASFDNNGGSALQADGATLENVDIESRNQGGDGVAFVGGGSFSDGRLYGSTAGGEAGKIDVGFKTNGAETGGMEIRRTTIESPSWGVNVDTPNVVTFVRRTRIVDPLAYGVRATNGAIANVHNSLITVDNGYAFSIQTVDDNLVIFNSRHVTIVDTGGDPDPVIEVGDGITPSDGDINAVISDTIIAGQETPIICNSPMSKTQLTLRYTWFFHSADVVGDCTLTTSNTLDAYNPMVGPPVFADPDFRLPAGSLAIDRGDPLVVTLPTDDLDGALRPVDGNGDGAARRDIGAYEYQPPVDPGPGGGKKPDSTRKCKKKKKKKGNAAKKRKKCKRKKRKP